MSEQYRKVELTSMIAILNKPGGLRMNRMITNIPDCNLSFITEDITSLKFDVSIRDLLSDIQTEKGADREEQRNAILRWLEEHKKDPKAEKSAQAKAEEKAIQATMRFEQLLKKGVTKMKAYQTIAEEMKVSPDTVRSYVAYLKRKEEIDEDASSEEEITGENGGVDYEEKE
jgi:hypothetical protein